MPSTMSLVGDDDYGAVVADATDWFAEADREENYAVGPPAESLGYHYVFGEQAVAAVAPGVPVGEEKSAGLDLELDVPVEKCHLDTGAERAAAGLG